MQTPPRRRPSCMNKFRHVRSSKSQIEQQVRIAGAEQTGPVVEADTAQVPTVWQLTRYFASEPSLRR